MIKGKRSVLLIYTGGTIGMHQNLETGALEPFNFSQITEEVPELKRFDLNIGTYQFVHPLDSSDMQPEHWVKIAQIIEKNYDKYDGFVVLHGTDTMAYTASALSFMLENLAKPVIFTGSQLPIGMLRTDGKENLITAIEIAADCHEDGTAIIPEVCIFFDSQLMRGNRTFKMNAENFNAFTSRNYPTLAHVGVHIKYASDEHFLKPPKGAKLKTHLKLDTHVAVFSLFPGIQESVVRHILNAPGLKGVVLRSFGSGNAPQVQWFVEAVKEAIDKGVMIVNVTQCSTGAVEMERYDTGYQLKSAGVVSGYDSTVEAAATKLMFLNAKYNDEQTVRNMMNRSIAGEITI